MPPTSQARRPRLREQIPSGPMGSEWQRGHIHPGNAESKLREEGRGQSEKATNKLRRTRAWGPYPTCACQVPNSTFIFSHISPRIRFVFSSLFYIQATPFCLIPPLISLPLPCVLKTPPIRHLPPPPHPAAATAWQDSLLGFGGGREHRPVKPHSMLRGKEDQISTTEDQKRAAPPTPPLRSLPRPVAAG